MEAIQFDNGAPQTGAQSLQQPERLLLPHFPLQLDCPGSSSREPAERFIASRFRAVYKADITHFLPFLLSTRNGVDVCAALGFQPAQQHTPLFLEYYLDSNIETALGNVAGTQVQREKVVEIGNLASGRQRATQTLFLLIADILHQAGYDWVVFTANRSVRQWMDKLELSPVTLGEALPERLPDRGANWGSYYADRPVMLVCNIQHGFEQLNQNRVIECLRSRYQDQIAEFVAALKK